MAVSPLTNKIIVANSGSNTVSIIDSDSGNATNIPVGTFPVQIAVSPTTNKIYVTNYRSNNLSVLDGFTNSKIGNISVGKSPSCIFIASSFGPMGLLPNPVSPIV